MTSPFTAVRTKIALAVVYALSWIGLSSQSVLSAEIPPDGITFNGGELSPRNDPSKWLIKNNGNSVVVTKDTTLENFSIGYNTLLGHTDSISASMTIQNGSTLFLDRFYDVGYRSQGNEHLTINGDGVLKMTWDFHTASTTEPMGAAIYLSADPVDILGLPPATMEINGVSLELLGDKGIRVDNGAHFTLDNYANPNGHLYIGVEEKDGQLVPASGMMYGGIEIVNGSSRVDIHTRDLKIYSSGSDEDGASLLNTSYNRKGINTPEREVLGQRGARTINIEADNMDFKALGGPQGFGIAIYAEQEQSDSFSNAEIFLKGNNFRLETDWDAALVSQSVRNASGKFVPNYHLALLDLNFKDTIYILAANQAISVDGNAEAFLNAKNIVINDTVEDGYPSGFISVGYAGLAELKATSYLGVTTNDPYLAVATGNGVIRMSAQNMALTTKDNNLIAWAGTEGAVQLNYDEARDAPLANTTSHLTGNFQATSNATINVGLGSTQSWLKGATSDNRFDDPDGAGSIRIHGTNNSVWYVKQFTDEDGAKYDSDLTEYHSIGRSIVDLTTEELGQNLNIVKVRGNGANFKLRTYVDQNRVGTDRDHIHIHEGTGAHTIYVASDATEWTEPNQADYLVWHDEQNGATSARLDNPYLGNPNGLSFALSNPGGRIDTGVYSYRLMTRNAADGSGTEWFLQRTDQPSNTTELVTVPAIAIPGAAWFAQLTDLRKRLGEVRYGAQDGLWARVITWEDDVDGILHNGFHQKAYGLNVGLDRIVKQDEKSMWLLGGNLKAYRAEQNFKTGAHGDGETDSYGLFLYATYADWDGYYADLVLSADRFYQKLHTTMSDFRRTGGRFHSHGLGASIEVGKMCSFMDNAEGWGAWYNNWFIEPQAQLSYYWVDGKSFTMDNGMKVSQGDGETLTGRLGVVLGKKYNYGKPFETVDKRYSQFYLTGGIKHEFAGEQDVTVDGVRFSGDMFGTRYYYGAGFDWNMTDETRLYAQIEREEGNRYDRDYYLTIGIKTNF